MVDFARLSGVVARLLGGPEDVRWVRESEAVALPGAIIDRTPTEALAFLGAESDGVGVEGETLVVHVETRLVVGLVQGDTIRIDGVDHTVARLPLATPDGMTRLALREV